MRSVPDGRTAVASVRADRDAASCSMSHSGIGMVRMPLSVLGPLTTCSPLIHIWVSLTVSVRRGQSMSHTRSPHSSEGRRPASTSSQIAGA